MSVTANLTLNDVCDFIVDCLHNTAPIQADGYPLIRTPNIGKGRLDFNGVQRVSEQTYIIWTRRAIPEPGDLILAREAPAGNVAVIKEGEKVCLGQRTVHIRPARDKVDPDFLCYFLLTPMQQGKLLASETGATSKHVNMKDIRKLDLHDLPNLETQVFIGSVLANYDDLIENNTRQIQLLEEAARQLYKEWFVRLRFPGHEQIKVVDGVPEGFCRMSLADLCQEKRDVVRPEKLNPETPYIGLEHMPRRSITLGDWEFADKVSSSKHKFQVGDILFGKIRPYFHKVGITFTDGIASSDALVNRSLRNNLLPLVLMVVSSDAFIAMTSKTVKEGSKMPRADWKHMQRYPVLLPPEGLLNSFNSAIEPILDQLRTLVMMNKKLQEARDLLLPRLMSGEIRA